MLSQRMSEYWEKHFCPKCGVRNWTYHSHSERAYPEPVGICECRNCKTHYWFGKAEDACFGDPQYVRMQKGRKCPDLEELQIEAVAKVLSYLRNTPDTYAEAKYLVKLLVK